VQYLNKRENVARFPYTCEGPGMPVRMKTLWALSLQVLFCFHI